MATTVIEGHTIQRYDGELNQLHLEVVKMAGLVLDQTKLAVQAWKDDNADAAEQVIKREHEVDQYEVDIDEKIIEVLARRSPVAKDLRIIMAFSKAVVDLERMGDLTKRISKLAVEIQQERGDAPANPMTKYIFSMGKITTDILHQAIEVLDTFDREKAEQLACTRSALNAEYDKAMAELKIHAKADSDNIDHSINIMLTLKSLARIGDHSRNLAEQAIFIITGADVRHQNNLYCPAPEDGAK